MVIGILTKSRALLILGMVIIAISIAMRIAPLFIYVHGSNSYREAVLVDFSINVDGGAAIFWDRVLSIATGGVLILKINSYGGYLSVADRIVNDILEKNITCYSWVPPGGYAVSAAAMIALACRDIFMGSGSVIGNAIPSPSDEKTVNYVASRFRTLAERIFGDNEELVRVAEAMVREGKTLTSREAIDIGFAKGAESVEDIERALGLEIVSIISPGSWDRLVSLLSLPIISNILLIAGVFLIIAEILTTGFQGYAIAGVLLMVLALYAMNIIHPDIFALILMITGLILLAIEMYTPGFGVFGLSGITLLAIGIGYQLYLTPLQLLTASVYVALGGIAALISMMGFVVYKAIQTSRKRRVSLEQQLLSSTGIAKTDIDENNPGVVYVLNEDWTAYSVKGLIPAGSKVRIVRVEGLKLYVEKLEQ